MKSFLRVLFLMLFCTVVVHAQNVNVRGVVMGDDGFPVIGATVVVKGNTSIGTVTDFDGNFSLSVPEGTKTLVISYVGFQTEEVAAKTGSEIKVTLSADTQVLDEVVVTGMVVGCRWCDSGKCCGCVS